MAKPLIVLGDSELEANWIHTLRRMRDGTKGGPGSGHWVHEGRPGQVGGSKPGRGLAYLGLGSGSSLVARRSASDAKRGVTGGGMGKPPIETGAGIPYKPSQAQIDNARASADKFFKHSIREHNLSMTPEELENKIRQTLQELDDEPVRIRRRIDGAEGVVHDGRFKTQFETKRSAGVYDPAYRTRSEYKGMGVPETIDNKKRPVYGYIAGSMVSNYGPVEFVLKDSVKERTSYTVGDSLGAFGEGYQASAPVGQWGATEAWDNGGWGIIDALRRHKTPAKAAQDIGGYIEAQIHGGVSFSDVARVVFHTDAHIERAFSQPGEVRFRFEALALMLKKNGIEVSYEPGIP